MSSKDIIPLISVIIPIYNVADYLPQCLNSVIGQTYRNLEIICVIDGSPDNSREIVSSFQKKDARIVIINQENTGVSCARNNGLKAAKGDYIVFLDGDDWIEERTCQTAISTAIDYDADVVMWSYVREFTDKAAPVHLFNDEVRVFEGESAKLLFRRMVGLKGEELKAPQTIDSLSTAWGKLYRANLIRDIEFIDMEEIGTEDALYNIDVFSRVQKAVYIPKCLSHYRKDNTSSLTHHYKKDLSKRWEKLYDKIRCILNENNEADEFYEALNNRIACSFIGLAISLVDDNTLTIHEKSIELKYLLEMEQYDTSIKALDVTFMPIHWKVFYILAKRKMAMSLSVLLLIMNYLRKH